MSKIRLGCEPIWLKGDLSTGCLLLHGLSGSPYEMKMLAEHLNQLGFTISVPLLPGHGTEPENLTHLLWQDWFSSAKEALFELRRSTRKIYILGQSLGGSLALHLAAHYEVNGIITLAPGLFLKSKLVRLIYPLIPFVRYYYKTSGSDIKANVETMTYHKIPLKAIQQLLNFFKHLQNDLQDVYTPTLIIYSAHDHVIDTRSAVTIYNQISSTDKRILRLENSFHIISLDLEKEKVFKEVENFINYLQGKPQ